MVKVITYGTYDLLHYGHIKLLERAKALGDYLIVGVTADDFDKTRGKINVQQSLMERIEAVRATGLADKIIVEEYEGQKIDDIRRYDVDIFTVGSDWAGKFDYLNEYCKVVYLPRTEGISSSEVRSEQCKLRMGIVGKAAFRTKFVAESKYVNGVDVIGVCASQKSEEHEFDEMFYTENYDEILEKVDAVYIVSKPEKHYIDTKKALDKANSTNEELSGSDTAKYVCNVIPDEMNEFLDVYYTTGNNCTEHTMLDYFIKMDINK